jgi:glycosyltransferase involved in cell wall biosynthesis
MPTDPARPRLSAVLITRNEEKKLEECLRSVSFADEIIIVDSGSSDSTPQIAARFGAHFSFKNFENFAAQKNAAIQKASGEWVLSIDADERLSSELAAEIQQVLKTSEHNGYWVRRENFIFGRHMRYGAQRDDLQLRLFRRDKAEFQGTVHERVELQGTCGQLTHSMQHHSTENLADYFRRFPLYTELEAQKIYSKGIKPSAVHILLKPIAEFIYFYFLRLGFLDGLAGLQYQILSSFYTSVKYMKALEFSKKAPQPTREKIAV